MSRHRTKMQHKRKIRLLQRALHQRAKAAGIKREGIKLVEYASAYFGTTITKSTLYPTIEAMLENEQETGEVPPLAAVAKRYSLFYRSDAWLHIRYKAFTVYDRICMCCGSENNLHVDHIKPKSKYPQLALEFCNLQILCHDCNIGKMAWDETDWRPDWAQKEYPLPTDDPDSTKDRARARSQDRRVKRVLKLVKAEGG